jgi:outer membrane protein assembly factor BamB
MKKTTHSLLCTLFCLSSCIHPSGKEERNSQNWSIFRGDASLSGYTNVSLPPNPTLLWEFKSDAYTKSSPIVYGGVAYWSSRRGRIYGVNSIGEQVFDYAMETAVDATPLAHDSVLYIGRIDGYLSAISLTTQETLWNFETLGQIIASPTRMTVKGKETIVFGSYDNYLYCVDSQSGAEVNRFESGYYINGAVAQIQNTIVYGGCDGWVRVVDAHLGVQTDSLDTGVYIPASPAISDNDCYIADHSGNVYEIKLKNGAISSHKKLIDSSDENSTFVSVPAVSERMVYVVSDDRTLYALHRKDGAIVWKYLLKGDTGESSPVVCKDKVLVCTRSGIVSIHNAVTGELLWEYDTGEQIIASPAVVKDCFYILTFRGTLFCFGRG